MEAIKPFHLAFPVSDIQETKDWYTRILGCSVGRESKAWIDFNFFGHQISAHLSVDSENNFSSNIVDSKEIPSRHFGVILEWEDWTALSERLSKLKIKFYIKPYVRFKDKAGEQGTLFIKDPSGNFLEFKSFRNDNMIFKKTL